MSKNVNITVNIYNCKNSCNWSKVGIFQQVYRLVCPIHLQHGAAKDDGKNASKVLFIRLVVEVTGALSNSSFTVKGACSLSEWTDVPGSNDK